MKLIIAGSRDLHPKLSLINEIRINFYIHCKEIVSGGASGVDEKAMHYAEHWGLKYTEFPADWDKNGKAAGPIRNKQMAEYGDALLLIWDGSSRGSANIKKEMEKLGKPVYEVIIKKPKVTEEL